MAQFWRAEVAQFWQALKLGLVRDATAAWEGYLEISVRDSLWAGEAAEFKRALTRGNEAGEPEKEGDPRKLRAWLFEMLLAEWPTAVLARDEVRTVSLSSTMAEVASTLTALGDAATTTMVAQVIKARGAERRALAELHARFERVRQAVKSSRSGAALDDLDDLLPRLDARGSPLADEGLYHRATAEFALARYDASATSLDALISKLGGGAESAKPDASYKGPNAPLLARARALRGLIYYFSGGPAAAIPLLRLALEDYPSFGSIGDLAYFNVLAMECFNILDDSRVAWQHFLAAAEHLPRVSSPRRRVQVLNSLADFTLRRGAVALSFRYQDEAVHWGRKLGDASFLADVLLWRAVVLSQLGAVAGAQADLVEAGHFAGKIEDPKRRRLAAADQQLIRGLLAVGRDPSVALANLTPAIDAFDKEGNRSALLLASEARAATARSLGDATIEREDLERSWRLYEQLGADSLNEPYRISLGSRWETVFDQLVRFEADRGRDELAFSYYTRGREITQSLPEPEASVLPERSEAGEPLGEIQAALGDDAVMVAYCLLEEQLLIFELRHDRFTLHRLPILAREFAERIELLTSRHIGRMERELAASDLYADLVAPWLRPGSDTTVILVPDKILFRLPFALLRNESGRMLVEQARIALAPSPRWAVVGPVLDQERSSETPLQALFVADPSFDRDAFPGLEGLASARGNVRQLASLFPGAATILVGQDATPSTVEKHLQAATLIDFSSHAVAGTATPLDSFLVLAPKTPGDQGTLTARRLLELSLKRTRFVSLSACRTGATLPGQWEGALQLARPFLQSGVPAVVATLWNIDDATSARFVSDLYQELARGATSLSAFHRTKARAARSAQSGDEIPDWAAFQLFGVPDLTQEEEK